MLNVDQARDTILRNIQPLEAQNIPLLSALGQVCAGEVRADSNVPDWDSSARDGFAVRSVDVQGASTANPRILRVIETVVAGTQSRLIVEAGTAIRIMTGAPLPPGADCVIQFEDTDVGLTNTRKSKNIPSQVTILREIQPGSNIRRAGEQIARGSVVVPQNALIGPAEIGVLASLGRTRVKVVKRPLAVIIGTGEELVLPGRPLVYPRIFNGNSYNIAAQVLRCGGTPRIEGIVRDNRTALLKKIRRGMDADLLITTGGVAFGDRDLIKDIMSELGELIFAHVAMSPGKSFSFGLLHGKDATGRIRKIPHFALAGNPPASMINFEILVRPAILKMMNKAHLTTSPIIEAVLEETINNHESLRHFEWVTVRNTGNICLARPTRSRTPEILSSIVLADGLAVVPEGCQRIEKGTPVQVILLDWR
jgi:molybdopterin molybdotransferase